MSLSAHPSEMGTAYIVVSALPQTYHPARLDLGANIGEVIGRTLADRVHDIQ